MKPSRTFEEGYHYRINRFFLFFLAGHIPAAMLIAACYGSGVLSAFVIAAGLLAGPIALFSTAATSPFTSAAVASAMMGMSALLIHLSHGLIEMHFHVFVAIALLVALGSIWPVLTAAGTIAVHHVLFWLFLPASVFNYKAGFGVVLLHAFFVIFEAIPACWVARTLGRSIAAQGITTGSLTRSADEVRSAASEIKTASVDLARWSSDQASTLEQTSASSEQVAAMTAQLSQESRNAYSSMTVVDSQLTEANAQLSKLATSMQAIERSTGKIAEIITVIDGIAFQTNILALNAAVEAARAGEAGAGFAVVADEVRSLAGRSAQAAQDSSELISNSVDAVRAGANQVQRIVATVSNIAAQAAQVKLSIEQVRERGEDQMRSMSQVSDALHNIKSFTRQTASAAGKNAVAGQSLQSSADQMFAAVNKLQQLGGRSAA